MSSQTVLTELANRGEDALVGYFPAGYPTSDESIEACVAMCEAGIDVLELGVPYSDPVMDGLVIQVATELALANGFKLSNFFETLSAITSRVSTPVLVMSYWNPILQYGVRRFAEDLKAAGASGLITPDLIPDEASDWLKISDELNLDRVFLATPSSSIKRLEQVASVSRPMGRGRCVWPRWKLGLARQSGSDVSQGRENRTQRASRCHAQAAFVDVQFSENFAFTLLSSGGGTCFSASKRVDRYNLIRVFNQLLAEQHSYHLRPNHTRRINCSTIL